MPGTKERKGQRLTARRKFQIYMETRGESAPVGEILRRWNVSLEQLREIESIVQEGAVQADWHVLADVMELDAAMAHAPNAALLRVQEAAHGLRDFGSVRVTVVAPGKPLPYRRSYLLYYPQQSKNRSPWPSRLLNYPARSCG